MADTNIDWPEYPKGMSPSDVNDSARAEMAAAAKWRDEQLRDANETWVLTKLWRMVRGK